MPPSIAFQLYAAYMFYLDASCDPYTSFVYVDGYPCWVQHFLVHWIGYTGFVGALFALTSDCIATLYMYLGRDVWTDGTAFSWTQLVLGGIAAMLMLLHVVLKAKRIGYVPMALEPMQILIALGLITLIVGDTSFQLVASKREVADPGVDICMPRMVEVVVWVQGLVLLINGALVCTRHGW